MSKKTETQHFIAGDIGGTKTTIGLYSTELGVKSPLLLKTYPSKEFKELEDVVEEFLYETKYNIRYACFGVAGPVLDGKAKVTNLPWHIDAQKINDLMKFEQTWLLNDLESLGESITSLGEEDLFTLNDKPAKDFGAIAILAPGTGLGEGFLVWNDRKYDACPSEGGHSDFAPINDMQIDLLRYLLKKNSHVSWEHVCSGTYLPNIYNFLKDTGRVSEPEWLKEKLVGVEDPNPIITSIALDDSQDCEICKLTLELFVSIMGTEAGNLALKVLSTGGVYLGGGIPAKILPALKSPVFYNAFVNKGRFEQFMRDLPIHVVLNSQAALIGAAHYCYEQIA